MVTFWGPRLLRSSWFVANCPNDKGEDPLQTLLLLTPAWCTDWRRVVLRLARSRC